MREEETLGVSVDGGLGGRVSGGRRTRAKVRIIVRGRVEASIDPIHAMVVGAFHESGGVSGEVFSSHRELAGEKLQLVRVRDQDLRGVDDPVSTSTEGRLAQTNGVVLEVDGVRPGGRVRGPANGLHRGEGRPVLIVTVDRARHRFNNRLVELGLVQAKALARTSGMRVDADRRGW